MLSEVTIQPSWKWLIVYILSLPCSTAKSSFTVHDSDFFLPLLGKHTYQIVIQNVKTSETVTLEDVLFGDVWLCSGQSNQQVRSASDNQPA